MLTSRGIAGDMIITHLTDNDKNTIKKLTIDGVDFTVHVDNHDVEDPKIVLLFLGKDSESFMLKMSPETVEKMIFLSQKALLTMKEEGLNMARELDPLVD